MTLICTSILTIFQTQKMANFVAVSIGLLTICEFTSPFEPAINKDLHNSPDLHTLAGNRIERSLWSTWRRLLKNAHVHRRGKDWAWYKKEGGYDQAVSDFTAFNPTGVVKTKDGYTGHFGDQSIQLYSVGDFTAIEILGKLKHVYPLRRELRIIEYTE